MRQTTKQSKTYQAPTIKVVQFMIELGAGASGYTEREEDTGKYEEIEATSSNSNPGWGIFE